MLENRFIEQDTVTDKVTFVTGDYGMSVRDYVVRVDSTGGALNVALPPVTEAAGRFYTIHCTANTGDITIQDQNESEDWSDLTMTAVDDGVALYSDGRKWWTLHTTLT